MAQLANRLLQFVRRHDLFCPPGPVVLGFSGGPDSVALALLLSELAEAGKLKIELSLAHLNHGLRGEEAEADEQFCVEFAAAHGLPLRVERADVRSAAEEPGASLESAARDIRYDFLGRVAEQRGARHVATAHHADDVAETVLMRLLRGAAVTGLGGLAPERALGPEFRGVRLVRPLLEIGKEELLGYLNRRGQSYRRDASNSNTDYTRNRVRHELIPRLEAEYPTFSAGSLNALNESAVELAGLLRTLVEEAWPDVCLSSDSAEVELSADHFGALDPAVRKALAERAIAQVTGGVGQALSAGQHATLSRLAEWPPGRELRLAGGVQLRREHAVIRVLRLERDGIEPVELAVPGSIAVPAAGMRIESRPLPPGKLTPAAARKRASDLEVFVRRDGLAEPLTVRGRRPGDRFRPLGAPGACSLKDFFIDQKVPRGRRDRTPLVTTADDRIVWVVGQRIDDGFKLSDEPGEAVALKASRLPRDGS